MDAAYWGPRPTGSERERIFDDGLEETSGEVDTERLIAELRTAESNVRDDALSDLREWLEAARADRARVRFERD